MPDHSTLTGSQLHEPKGASTASADTVYVADGAGSGAWAKVDTANLDATSIFMHNKFILSCSIADVSTATTVYLPVPYASTLDYVVSSLNAAITVANSIITIRDHGGNSAGTLTIAYTGSGAGDIDTLTPASNNVFTANQNVRIVTDGGSTTTAPIFFTLVFTRTE
jgi:hypothetical protein